MLRAAAADIHVVVLVLGLLLHGQLLQRGIDVQLVRLQLPQQRLSLQKGSRHLSRDRRCGEPPLQPGAPLGGPLMDKTT